MKFKREDENYVYEVASRNIKRIRENLGLTQEQFAEKIDYNKQFISNIESTKNYQTFSLGTLWRISIVFDIDISLFFDESVITEKEKKEDLIKI